MSVLNSTGVLEVHPACLIMPEMDDADFQKLKEDISGFGLRHPITLYQGMILDGRHRYRACIELEIEPEFEDWNGGSSVVEFVLGENLHRRHLSVSQRAMAAANAIEYHREEAKKRNSDKSTRIINDLSDIVDSSLEQPSIPGMLTSVELNTAAPIESTRDEAPIQKGKAAAALAKTVGVSQASIEQAVFVKEKGTADDVKAVATGQKSVKAVAQEVKARQPPKAIAVESNPTRCCFVPITVAQWESLDDATKQAALTAVTDKKFNNQDNDSIDWAAFSWNPITGCEYNCNYCYARDIANRFYGELKFTPALHPDRLLIPANHKNAGNKNNRVFTCSMSDLFGHWVPTEWIEAVLSIIRDTPQFEFLLLTKNPKRLLDFDFPVNCWVGTTCDSQQRMNAATEIFQSVKASVKWVSVEPMLEQIVPSDPAAFDWYVIGGASSTTQQGGFIPPFDWVARLALAAIDAKKAVFIKTNFWNAGRLQEFPQP